jgi:hypothetical protein
MPTHWRKSWPLTCSTGIVVVAYEMVRYQGEPCCVGFWFE